MKHLVDPASAFAQLQRGDSVVVHSACSDPAVLGRLLAEQAKALDGVNVHTLMPMGQPPYAEEAPASHLRLNSFFPGVGLRKPFNAGRVNALRYSLSAIPGLFDRGELKVQLLLLQVSPPDECGYVSMGLSIDYMRAALRQKPVIIAEINPKLPATCGDTRLPVTDIDWFVNAEGGPQTIPAARADILDEQIAANVAALVDDGAVLQVGIGSLPDQVLAKLANHKNLGVHTGIITEAMQPLIESGVINNATKKQFAGVSVTTMAGGSQDFYDFLHQNTAVEFHPCDLTHGAKTLTAIDGLTAINSALQVDLSGFANAEQVNGKIVAMPGGLPDFAAGAARASGGKSILAIRSSFKDGQVSNIIGSLDGATKTLVPDNIDFVVTEYGVAQIRGVSEGKRAESLIAIAHPNFRDELQQAFKQ